MARKSEISRRCFALTGVTTAGLLISGQLALGDGGQDPPLSGQITYGEGDEEDDTPEPHGYPQSRFLRLPRKQMHHYIDMPNVYVEGFSFKMSNHLFVMGYNNIRGTRSLVRTLQEITTNRDRRALLRQERNTCKADLSQFSGSSSARLGMENYCTGVSYWASHPREGRLKLKYKY